MGSQAREADSELTRRFENKSQVALVRFGEVDLALDQNRPLVLNDLLRDALRRRGELGVGELQRDARGGSRGVAVEPEHERARSSPGVQQLDLGVVEGELLHGVPNDRRQVWPDLSPALLVCRLASLPFSVVEFSEIGRASCRERV